MALNVGKAVDKGSEDGFTPVPNGTYEVTITRANKPENFEFVGLTLKVRDDVEQQYKNRYISGILQVHKSDAGIKTLDVAVDEDLICKLDPKPTEKDTRDWLSLCEYMVGKNVKVVVKNQVNSDGSLKYKTDKVGNIKLDSKGNKVYKDPFLNFYKTTKTNNTINSVIDQDDLPF